MPTLVLSPRFTSDTQCLWRACNEVEGWDTHRAHHNAVPDNATDPCCYGELMFCDIMASRMGLALLDPPDDFLSRLVPEYVKRTVHFTHIYDIHRETERKFYKPANDKLFPAKVYDSGRDIPMRYVSQTCPVLVSDIVSFDAEVRCYVLDGEIVTASSYYKAVGLRMDPTRGGAAWLRHVLKDPDVTSMLPSAVVIDVGLIPRRGWAIIEANQAYASGIYDEADGKALLPLILRASGLRSTVRTGDVPYIRQ